VIALPFVVLIVYARLEHLDPAHMEAARDLGASRLRAVRDITVPLVRPAVLGAALIAGALSLDEVVVAFFIHGNAQTLPLLVFGLIRLGVSPTVNALATLILCATLGLALIAGRLTRIRT
jgi:spermidine/putrescine transport system permease protein